MRSRSAWPSSMRTSSASMSSAKILSDGRNALLCRPDCAEALAAGIRTVTGDAALAGRLAATALADSRQLTWSARARRIAAILEERMRAAPIAAGGWDRAQRRAWMRASRRWAVHLARRRSWVLPPGA